MKIYFASDHAGFEHKNSLLEYARDELGHEVEDIGAHEVDPQDDYPLIISVAARMLARDVQEGLDSRAIILGGSGQGEAMVANRFPGVRAAVYYGGSDEMLRLSRDHNDANILSLGARFMDVEAAKHAMTVWFGTPFSGEERHIRRIAEIETIVTV